MSNTYCPQCGELISPSCRMCPQCGSAIPTHTTSSGANTAQQEVASARSPQKPSVPVTASKPKCKWISLVLCIFTVCGHKFYEGKTAMGLLYLFTVGLFGIGWIIDIIKILSKPNPYYVR